MAKAMTVADLVAVLLAGPQDAEVRVTQPLDIERSVNVAATAVTHSVIGPLVYADIT